MDQDLKIALLRNLVIKTKIVIGLFVGVFLLQIVGISFLFWSGASRDIPMLEAFTVPAFIAIVIIDELFILKYVRMALNGERNFPEHMNYIIVVLEILYPTIVLYYGGHLFQQYQPDITPFMFLNSPPLFIYVLLIVLSIFHFNFKLSLLSGVIAGLGFLTVSYFVADDNGAELLINVSKVPFLILSGLVAGFVGKRLLNSVKDSLESKNTLIHKLDEKVKERTVKIEEQKEQLATQNKNLEEKNKEITDSIVYAKRIQSAILPEDDTIKQYLSDSFVLYLPKDIVAGDFYWLEPVEDGVLFAAADCTGHGVPGAMVSVVCNNAMNQAVREFGKRSPGEVLDQTRDTVVAEFDKGSEEVKDGMDIALCALRDMKLEYSGANNPLWIVRNGELIEQKATKQPVGKYDKATSFENHQIDLEKGDTIYLFSDGFADQFGGEKGKKYKAANFKKLLLSLQNESMDRQKELIHEAFEKWKGEMEQLDDVCIIGVRIPLSA